MKTTKPKNKQNRGYIFGIVLHPKFPDNYKSPSCYSNLWTRWIAEPTVTGFGLTIEAVCN